MRGSGKKVKPDPDVRSVVARAIALRDDPAETIYQELVKQWRECEDPKRHPTVLSLVEATGISQSSVRHHLSALTSRGCVRKFGERTGCFWVPNTEEFLDG